MNIYLVSPLDDDKACWECGRSSYAPSAVFSSRALADSYVARWGGQVDEIAVDEEWFGAFTYGIEKYDDMEPREIPMPDEPGPFTDAILGQTSATRLWNCCWQFIAHGTTPELAKENAERLMRDTLRKQA